MASKWIQLKPKAVELRKRGLSIGKIEERLKIPRSTLSYWFKDIVLNKVQQEKLIKNWQQGLVKARKGAVKWHNTQKLNRLATAKEEAHETLIKINTENVHILELALSILYLAEGSKKNTETALGSSDPETLQFFISALKKIYNYNISTIRCELYLRADQEPEILKRYWSKQLKLPLKNFKHVNIDKRSAGKKTYANYKGVCSLRCGQVAIQRRLVFLAREYFGTIAQQ